MSSEPLPGGGDAGRTAGVRGRRSFLLMAGAAVGAGALSSCISGADKLAGAASSVRPLRPARVKSAVTTADWAALRRDLSSHKLLRPGNNG